MELITDNNIEKLYQELDEIKNEIAGVQEALDKLVAEREVLLRRKKNLQWQTMFYIDKIQNNIL